MLASAAGGGYIWQAPRPTRTAPTAPRGLGTPGLLACTLAAVCGFVVGACALVLAALGGSMQPLEFFPDGLRRVAFLTPHAWMNDALWRILVEGAGLSQIWTSLLVRCYAWLVLLQRKGIVNTWLTDLGVIETPLRMMHNFTGTTIGMVHIMLPFMVLPLYGSMKAISGDYMRAASSLGASPVKAFWQVFVPLSLPGLAAGVIIGFVLCLGFYVTPALLGGGRVMMWSMQIERNVTYHSDWGAASALGVVLLVMTLGILWLVGRFVGFDKIVGGR